MTEQNKRTYYQWVMVVIFLLLAVSFLLDLWGSEKEVAKNPLVDKKDIINSTVRDPLTGPVIRQAGFTYSCNDCHLYKEPAEAPKILIAAHEHIKMEHGINSNCYNCHHKKEREFLTDIDGNKIPLTKSEQLCQKCHGARYKDWTLGIHGRQDGYWHEEFGEVKRATCVACHNPHSPKFKPMRPLPGPYKEVHSLKEDVHHE